jgi:hypothetical protein
MVADEILSGKKVKERPFLMFVFALHIFTVSFDFFLNFIIAGYNFRVSMLFLVIPFLAYIVSVIVTKRVPVPLGAKALLIWALLILFFIPNSIYIRNGVLYGFWLIFYIIQVFTMLYFFDTERKIDKLIKLYIYSFLFVSVFGLYQFISPMFGLAPVFVTQWWMPDQLARINAFSYEPSYFATYMIPGWILCYQMVKHKVDGIIPLKRVKWIFVIITVCLILSSSRMGWIIMIVWLLQIPFKLIYGIVRTKVRHSQLKQFVVLLVSSAAVIAASVMINRYYVDLTMFLDGLGIAGGATHSSGARIDYLRLTVEAFTETPFIGRSLGGITPALATLQNLPIGEDINKITSGMFLAAELLVASGLFAFIPLLVYLFEIVFKPLKLANKITDPKYAGLLKAFGWGIVFQFMIMQFNHNILRPYFWLQVSILCIVYAYAKRKAAGEEGAEP